MYVILTPTLVILQLNWSFWRRGGLKNQQNQNKKALTWNLWSNEEEKQINDCTISILLFVIKSYLFSITLRSLHVYWAWRKVATLATSFFCCPTPPPPRSMHAALHYNCGFYQSVSVASNCPSAVSVKCLLPLICSDIVVRRDVREDAQAAGQWQVKLKYTKAVINIFIRINMKTNWQLWWDAI